MQELTESTLRCFVRGELSDEDESDLYRLLVRCSDPALPHVIENLRFEWEQEKQDSKLSDTGQRLGRMFLQLWRSGDAEVDTFLPEYTHTPALQVAQHMVKSDEAGIAIHRRVEDDDTFLQIRALASDEYARVSVWATTDKENVRQMPNSPFKPGTPEVAQLGETQEYELSAADKRVTIWFVATKSASSMGVIPPEKLDMFVDWLERVHSLEDGLITAVRFTPRVLTDYYEP